MYPVLHALLSDKKGGAVFTCFGPWHLCYLLAAVLLIALVALAMRKKPPAARRRVPAVFINVAFGLYVADFFLMPFAYEQIDIEKLPFHVCTAMCVMCFLSRRLPRLERWRVHLALLGFVSNLVYLIYPAGVMWYGVHPLCYRVVQTLAFHAVMTAYGFFTLLYEGEALQWRSFWREVPVLAGMTLWAILGNLLYNGAAGSYAHHFNWFFVTADPFGLLPAAAAPFVMPFVDVALFLAAEALLYGVIHLLRKARPKP